jgi:chemotaxis protein methyltransferase CheR
MSGQFLIDQPEISDETFSEIGLILENQRGFSLSNYKDKCMKRRITIRMRSRHCHDGAEYCTLLRQSGQELDLLKKNLTIHVSQFFRNPSMFDTLQRVVLPQLFATADSGQVRLRVSSLGCAGGEEAYSLGIILRHAFAREIRRTQVEIRAYDIDADILLAAKKAEYNVDRLKDVPDAIRERYFVLNGHRMQLSAEVRSMATFHQQNIIDVGTFEACQLALCRNTLIYFTRENQEKILRGIAQILPVGGILVLGKSETLVGEAHRLFTAVCPVERIYRRL